MKGYLLAARTVGSANFAYIWFSEVPRDGVLASGVALAATFDGTPAADTFVGTQGPDDIRGRGGDDTLSGAGGRDRVRGDGATTGYLAMPVLMSSGAAWATTRC